MTITNENAENLFAGNGATTVFPTNIYALDEEQIEVYLREDGLDTLQNLTIDYSVSGIGNPAGVTVTMLVAPTATEHLVVVRLTPKTQELNLTSSRAYNPEALMTALDRVVMMMQEVTSQISRAFKVKPGIGAPLEIEDSTALAGLVTATAQAQAAAAAAAASAAAALAKENSMLRRRGAWLTGTAYTPSDIVREDGSAYICLEAHTSGVFATDLSAGRWEIFVQKGAAGAGSGDMLNSDNLNGLTNKPLALSTIGGQPSNAKLTSLAGLTIATGDIITAADGSSFSKIAAEDGKVLGWSGGAPVALSGISWEYDWHPYDKADFDDDNDGLIWSHGVSGNTGEITTADFINGYDYMLQGFNISLNANTFFDLEFWLESSAARSTEVPLFQLSAITQEYDFYAYIHNPRKSKESVLVSGHAWNTTTTGAITATPINIGSVSVLQKRQRMYISARSGSIDKGDLYLYKKKLIL